MIGLQSHNEVVEDHSHEEEMRDKIPKIRLVDKE